MLGNKYNSKNIDDFLIIKYDFRYLIDFVDYRSLDYRNYKILKSRLF